MKHHATRMLDTLVENLTRTTDFRDEIDVGGFVLRFPSGMFAFSAERNTSSVVDALTFSNRFEARLRGSCLRDRNGDRPTVVSVWEAACDEIASLRVSIDNVDQYLREAA